MPVTRLLRKKSKSKPITSSDIFITGGIGDVLAVSCFMGHGSARNIFYATRPFEHISQILERLFPEASHHCVWHDWSQRDAFYSLKEFSSVNNDAVIQASQDWSIHTVFKQDLEFKRAPWLGLSDPIKVYLPIQYAVLCPRSTDKREPTRDFTEEEVVYATDWAERRGIPLVHVYCGPDECPLPSTIINLQNKTNILETIAVVENASWYIGIDSCQSQVATKTLSADHLLIKSVNPHYYQSLKWYCCPHKEFPFVVPRVTAATLTCLERKA